MKLLLAITTIFFYSFTYSQNVNIEDILTYLKSGDAVKAKSTSDLSIQDKNLINNPKTWYYRAITYHSIYESEIKEVNSLTKKPLFEAYNSYLKTLELDKDKKFNSEVIKALLIVASQFVNEGVLYFNKKDYQSALSSFENNIAINRLPAINQIDTIVLFNAAISAQNSGNNKAAIEYYNQLVKMEYGGSQVCLDLAKLYKTEGNNEEYINTIKNGLKTYITDDIILINELANYYIEIGKNDEAEIYVDKGIYREPKNQSLHFVKASLLEQKGDVINAEKEYLTTLKIDSEYTDALFNISAMYYNQATDIIKKTTSKEEQNKAFEIYKKTQPYLEKLYNQTPNDTQILKMLKTVYTLLKQDEKLKEINKKLENSNE
ncbi:MAG: hypothetical protein A2X08_13495 [Bacteroidetes bacterium GWA2_32_17]|nr:MAG: hypothetical protein A2X08_13495 [Bacteroidetes bacterium GWA2_32_17]